MTLRHIDGMGGYNTAQISRKYATFTAGITVNATGGRRGGPSMRFSDWNQRVLLVIIPTPQSTMFLGFALKISALPTVTKLLARFRDGVDQCSICLKPDGTVEAHNGDQTGAILGAASVASITPGIFCYIEIKVVFHTTLGSMEVRKDGATILNLTNVDTTTTVNNQGDTAAISIASNASEAVTMDIDDIYVCDASGIINNNFQGDIRVDTVFPNGAGATTGWTPSTGSNYQNVDDDPANDDTDYNSSGVAAAKDTYAFPDIPPTVGNVIGVVHNITVRKDDTLTHTFRDVVRRGGTDYPGTTKTATATYAMYTEVKETDPSTSALWTIANVNLAEFGVELVS